MCTLLYSFVKSTKEMINKLMTFRFTIIGNSSTSSLFLLPSHLLVDTPDYSS
jgi:hypothetical protein